MSQCGVVALSEHPGQVHFAHHHGQDVSVVEVEVVAGAVEVGGHDCDVVCAVLSVEAFAEFESGYFGYGVRFVGEFEWRCEQCVFVHGLWCFAWVYACRAEEYEASDAVAPCFADDVLLYLEVLVYEVGGVGAVGEYSADVCGGEDYGVGLFLVEECAYCVGVEQVELAVGTAYEVGVSALYEVVPYCRAYEAAVSGDVYLGRWVE